MSGSQSQNSKRQKQSEVEPVVVNCFNFKGGVGKTTTTHLMFHTLVGLGYNVVCFDFDPQCSLSWSVLNVHIGAKDWDAFLDENKIVDTDYIIQTNLEDNHLVNLSEMNQIDCPRICKLDNETELRRGGERVVAKVLESSTKTKGFLVPARQTLIERIGDFDSQCSNLSQNSVFALKLVWVQNNMRKIAKKLDCLVILIDLNPALNKFNKVMNMFCDRLVIPCAIDCFSSNALKFMKREFENQREQASDDLFIFRSIANQGVDSYAGFTKPRYRYMGHTHNNYRNHNQARGPRAFNERTSLINEISRDVFTHANGGPSTEQLLLMEFEDFGSSKQYSQLAGIPTAFMNNRIGRYINRTFLEGEFTETKIVRYSRWQQQAISGVQKIMAEIAPQREPGYVKLVSVGSEYGESEVIQCINERII